MHTKKLIRDRIPEIIAASGRKAVTRVMKEAEYRRELRRKLDEELEEYLEAETDPAALEELADLMELIQVLATLHDSTPEELERIRAQKAKERGSFTKRLFLDEIRE